MQGYFGLAAGRGVAMALAPAAAQLSMTPVGRMVFFAGNRSFPWQLPAADARQLLTGYAAAPGYDAVNWVCMFDVPTDLPTVTQPVLFLQGTADPMTGQVLRYLPLIPHAELRLLPGLNHVPISDDPGGTGRLHAGVPAEGLTPCQPRPVSELASPIDRLQTGRTARSSAGERNSSTRTRATPATINTPPTSCISGRQLAEEQPGEQHREQHLGQADERRQLRAENPGGGDADHVGQRGGDHRQPDAPGPAS